MDEFKTRYHTKSNPLRCFRFDRQTIAQLINETSIKAYFTKSKIDFSCIFQQNNDVSYEQFVKIFFNEHIPIDLVAVGIKLGNDSVDWKYCLSGFIGGDFYRMTLGWDDAYISKENDRWDALKKYINYLYTESNNRVDLRCKQCPKI